MPFSLVVFDLATTGTHIERAIIKKFRFKGSVHVGTLLVGGWREGGQGEI